MTSRRNVLIAGAGPTGLTLAIELARRDVPFRLVEAVGSSARSSRGKGIQPRTLEVFEDLGVLDAVQAASRLYPRFRVHAGPLSFAAGRLGKVAEPSPIVPFPNLWLLPQWRTEEILRTRLERLGHHVEFGAALTSFEQETDAVTATMSTVAGVERVRADYLVGCDGGHSVVRKALGVRFEGEALPARPVLVADVEIRGLDSEYWHVWPLAKGGILALCPLPGTPHFQLTALLSTRGVAPETTEDGIREFIGSRICRNGVRVGCVTWASVFRPHVRMVDRYRVGRVLLAGDAAHVHPPSGGQGLNTGIQDAYNLGWKLAQVLEGAPEALLDSYQSERSPIAASVLGLSKRLMQNRRAKRGTETQQLDLHYRGSPLAMDDAKHPGRVRAGNRAPDAPCVDANGTQRRLFEIFRGTHLTLLAFGGSPEEVLARVRERRGAGVKIVGVIRPSAAKRDGVLVDVAGHAHHGYGVSEGAALVLVRPDGYIGYFGRPGSWARLDQYLSLVLSQLSPGGTGDSSEAWHGDSH
jgi:2-polyprenyl-6-methoxyphenol hydroxylase-like FAD-dependent oxidoreductase